MDKTNIFPFLSIFAQNFYYFPPKTSNFEPIQLDIIAYIVSKVMNYTEQKKKGILNLVLNYAFFI